MRQFFTFLRELRHYGLEKSTVGNRYYSKYMGTVEVSADPQGQARVQVSCKVGTNRDEALSVFAYPSAEYAGPDKGVFWPPDEGDKVWVWFDHGDLTQPRYSGGFWGNRQQDKAPAGSQVPAEFNPGNAAPKKRGFKTKAGHGMLFEDTDDQHKVVVWTGEQGVPGAEATKKHRVELDSTTGAEQIVVVSDGGHQSSWVDIVGQEKIEHKSNKGHFFKADDVTDFVEMATALGYSIKADEAGKLILITTPLGQQIAVNDTTSTILIKDASGDLITMGPTGVSISSTGLVNVAAAGAVSVAAGGAASVTALGALALTGTGLAITSAGGAPSVTVAGGPATSSFAGDVTDNFAGALKQTIAGVWEMTVNGIATVQVAAAAGLNMGGAGTKRRLMDERWIALFLQHVHQDSLAADTTTPTLPGGAPFPAPVEVVSTNFLRGN